MVISEFKFGSLYKLKSNKQEVVIIITSDKYWDSVRETYLTKARNLIYGNDVYLFYPEMWELIE